MNNKKYLRFVESLKYLKERVRPQDKKYFDVATSLYVERKIEKKNTMYNVANLLASKVDKKVDQAKELIKKYKKYNPAVGIKETGRVLNPQRKYKNFHIQANVKCEFETLELVHNRKRKKSSFIEKFTESRVIKAKTLTEAKEEYKQYIQDVYEFIDSWKIQNIDSIEFKSVYISDEVKTTTSVSVEKMRRVITENVNYDYIKEYKGFLDTTKNMCVIDNISGYIGINKDLLISKIRKYYNEIEKEEDDFGFPVEINWQPEDGVSPEAVQYLCKFYDVTHYCYDVTKKCILKNISKSRNRKSLCYFAVNGHMYLITDENMKKSMMEKAKDNNDKIKTVLIDDVTASKQNIFEKLDIHENIEVKDVTKYKSCIFMYTRDGTKNDLNEILIEFIKTYNLIPSQKNITSMNHKIIKFSITLNNEVYYFVLDPNEGHRNIDYKLVKKLCQAHNIEFVNQSFVKFISEFREKFFDEKNGRHHFTQTERIQLYNKLGKKCNTCKKCLDDEFHIDHIRPLANGGNNDDDNLQLLCIECHQEKCQNEIEQGQYIKIDDTISSFNNEVTNIINSDLCKSWAFVEKLTDASGKLFNIDINKCRTEILYNGKYDYPVFSVMDSVQEYNGQSQPGYYYISTNNYIPLRGNGWYTFPMVDFCLKKNIIKPSNIKYCVTSSFSIPANYYNEFIDVCRSKFGNLAKLAINAMIGAFNININRNIYNKTIGIVKGSCDAYRHYFDGLNSDRFMNCFEIEGEKYYHMFENIKRSNMETESPIYKQIIELENIKMYELKSLIESKGGVVLDLNTDCCSCVFPNNVFPFELLDEENIKGYYYDEEQKKPMYKLEEKDRLKYEKCKQKLRTEVYHKTFGSWNEIDDVKDNDFSPLVDEVVESKESYSIIGRAGCGKSTLIKEIQKKLKDMGKNWVTLTPTNKSALIIDDAITLHKFRNKMKTQTYLRKKNIDYIFVDEISMVHEIFYKFLLLIKKIKKDIKFIISGDFAQLAPVCDRYKGDYKNSQALYELSNGNRINLTTCRRSDDKLYKLCIDVKNVDKTLFENKLENVNLCYTNEKRKQINKYFMKKYKNKHGIHLPKKNNVEQSQDVILIEGMPIIAYKTVEKMNIVNNEIYQIEKIEKNIVYFGNDAKQNLKVDLKDFQTHFLPAYAITIHKSQGSTFDFPYTIHEWKKLDEKLKYVALSRSTKINNINII